MGVPFVASTWTEPVMIRSADGCPGGRQDVLNKGFVKQDRCVPCGESSLCYHLFEG